MLKLLRILVPMLVPATLLLTLASTASGQSSEKSGDESRGYTFYESFQGSSNTLGQVYRLDTTAGYNFNKHFGIDGGLPIYFVRASSTSISNGFASANGLGNAYLDLRVTLDNPVLNYSSTLTGTAPTGDSSKGFSTGRATYDWNNHVHRDFGGLRPFANLGVANSISDTEFFVRPFTTLGTVTHLEGGASLRIIPRLRVGASAYDYVPSGQQKVFSKLIARQPGALRQGMSRKDGGVFENSAETVGGPSISRDHGFTTWATASLIPFVDLMLGYQRSAEFDLNTVSFGLGFNLSYFVNKARGR